MQEKNKQNGTMRELAEYLGTILIPLSVGLGLIGLGGYNIMSPDSVHNVLFTRAAGIGELAAGMIVGGATIYFENRTTRRIQEGRNNTPVRRR